MDAAALPAAALEHAAYGLGQSDVGIRDHQPYARQAALLEAAQELTPEGLALAVTDLQAEQLSAAVGIDAHGHDDGPRANLQRLAEPPVQVRRIPVEVRVAAAVQVCSSCGNCRLPWSWPVCRLAIAEISCAAVVLAFSGVPC